jgi:hypothetical protein
MTKIANLESIAQTLDETPREVLEFVASYLGTATRSGSLVGPWETARIASALNVLLESLL